MAPPQTDLTDASHQIFVLSFELVDAEIAHLPEQIKDALTSPQVQAAIEKTLLDFAKGKAQSATTLMAESDAQKLVESLRTGVTDAGTKVLLEKIKTTPEYKRLLASIDAFKKAAQSSALGVWVDANKKILYVVGAGLVVGGATVLYLTKTGKLVGTAVNPLKDKQFEVLHIGKLHIKASLWEFKPDARVLGARLFGTADWQNVKLELKFGVLAEGAQIQQIEGAAVIKTGAVSLAATSNATLQTHVVNLGLNVGYQAGKFNVGLGAMYQDNLASGTASLSYTTKNATFGLQGNLAEQKSGGVQYGALLTLTIPVH